jgi:hypothetical protein
MSLKREKTTYSQRIMSDIISFGNKMENGKQRKIIDLDSTNTTIIH